MCIQFLSEKHKVMDKFGRMPSFHTDTEVLKSQVIPAPFEVA